MSGIHKLTGGGYGKKLKDDYRRLYGSIVGFSGRGEMLPNKDCYCEIDPSVVDKYGIPVLRFHWKWTDGELNQARHMNETAARIIEAMGGKVVGKLPGKDKDYGLKLGGEIIHEAGHHAHGHQPPHVRPQRVVPGPRLQEPLRRGQRAVRQQRAQEHDLDDPRPLHADERAHRRGAQEGEPMSAARDVEQHFPSPLRGGGIGRGGR
jgi:hypothetical protein